jgi:uncharacterized protein (TIGR01741 family)
MDTSKCEFLYSEIANKLNEIIPTEWSKILFYAEVEPEVVNHYYCFYEADSGNLVQFGDIVDKYGINENELKLEELKLTSLAEELNNEFANNNQRRWTTMTFILERNGEFHIDYSYENLNDNSIVYRRKQWKKKYLNL